MSSLGINKRKTCLIVIDMMKGMSTMQTQPYDVSAVLRNNVKLANTFRGYGMQVFLVRADFGANLWFQPTADLTMGSPGEMPNDWTDIAPELGPKPSDVVIAKRQWGAFYGTDLDMRLRRLGLDTIVLSGIATTYGVESTARFAYEYGYQQIFVEDAMTDFSKEAHANAVEFVLKRLGRVRKTEQLVLALQPPPHPYDIS